MAGIIHIEARKNAELVGYCHVYQLQPSQTQPKRSGKQIRIEQYLPESAALNNFRASSPTFGAVLFSWVLISEVSDDVLNI